MRRALNLVDGDQVLMRVIDGELHVRPARDTLKRIQAMLRPYASADSSAVDELIAERGVETARG